MISSINSGIEATPVCSSHCVAAHDVAGSEQRLPRSSSGTQLSVTGAPLHLNPTRYCISTGQKGSSAPPSAAVSCAKQATRGRAAAADGRHLRPFMACTVGWVQSSLLEAARGGMHLKLATTSPNAVLIVLKLGVCVCKITRALTGSVIACLHLDHYSSLHSVQNMAFP